MIRVRMSPPDKEVSVPTESFLAEVAKRPCLWDPTHRRFREESARKLALRLIVDKLIEAAPEDKKDEMGKCLYKKWKGIREHYFNMKKDPSKMNKYNSNRYFQLLEFLDSTLPSCPQRENIKSAPTKATVADTKFVAIKDQKVNEANSNFIGSSQSNSSSSLAVKCSTSQLESSPTDEVPSTFQSDNKDPGCDPKKRSASGLDKEHMGELKTSVMIDGVEFEQVTLDSGEVIVKLKDEVLEDSPLPKIIDSPEENPPITPVSFEEITGVEQAVHSKQLGNHNELNSTRAQLNGNQEGSESLRSYRDHGLELEQTPPINELKITGTTTLASTAWVSMPNNDVHKSALKKATAVDRKIAMKDHQILVNLGSVDDMVKSVLTSSNQVFEKLADALKSPDELVSMQSDYKKTATMEESGSIEIPDDGKNSNLTTRGYLIRSGKPLPSAIGPGHWSAELKRIGALSRADALQHGNSQQLNATALLLRSPPNLTPIKRLKTNRNTEVLKELSNQNTITQEDQVLSKPSSENSRASPPVRVNELSDSSVQETQGKRVRTNRNTVLAPNKRTRSNRNVEQPKVQLPTDSFGKDESSISVNDGEVDSPDGNENKSFLLSLLPEMESMTATQNFDFRLAVMEALSRAKLSNS